MTARRGAPEGPEFVSLGEFVAFVARAYARQIADQHTVVWCPRWWEHEEAVLRLGVLWEAYEDARCEGPSARSDWWLLHLDPHMAHLLGSAGPFKYCSSKNGHKHMIEPLPCDEPPIEFARPTRPTRTVA